MSEKKSTTIYDIAHKLNISTGTVYRALHNTGRISPVTRQRVLETAKSMGYKVNPAAQALSRSPIYIGAVLCCPVKQYLDEIKSGVCGKLEELKQYNVFSDVRVFENCNSQDKSEEIICILNEFKEKKYSGVILFLSGDNSFAAPYIDELCSQNIMTACVANDISGVNTITSVCADGVTAGSLAAEILSLGCKGKDVCILTGSRHTSIHSSNIEGFLNYSKSGLFSDIKIYEHEDKEELIRAATDEILNENKTKGIYMTSASSVYACRYLSASKAAFFPQIVTTDFFTQSRSLLNDGLICATIYQNPYKQGRKVTELIYDMINKKTGPVKRLLIPQAVFRSNMQLFNTPYEDEEL